MKAVEFSNKPPTFFSPSQGEYRLTNAHSSLLAGHPISPPTTSHRQLHANSLQSQPLAKMSSDQVAVFQTASPQTGQKQHQSSTSPHPSIQGLATTPSSSPDSPSQQPSAQALPVLSTSTQTMPPLRASENSRPVERSSADQMPSQESDQSDDDFLGLTGPQCVFCDMCLDAEPPCCCPSCELPN